MSDALGYGLAFFLPLAGALFIVAWILRLLLSVFRTFGLDRV